MALVSRESPGTKTIIPPEQISRLSRYRRPLQIPTGVAISGRCGWEKLEGAASTRVGIDGVRVIPRLTRRYRMEYRRQSSTIYGRVHLGVRSCYSRSGEQGGQDQANEEQLDSGATQKQTLHLAFTIAEETRGEWRACQEDVILHPQIKRRRAHPSPAS